MMKAIIFFAMLVVLVFISGNNLQNHTGNSASENEGCGVCIPVAERNTINHQAGDAWDTAAADFGTCADNQGSMQSSEVLLSGKRMAGLGIVL